ncbi:TlpA family protein disulfide reductase [Acidobacteriota bacterium]
MKKNKLLILSSTLVLLVSLVTGFLFSQENPPEDAPDFTLTDMDGNTITLSELKGNVVFLNFWATWCTPCKKEIPFFNEAYKTHKDSGLKIIGISIDRSKHIVKRYLAKQEFLYPIAMGNQKFLNVYGIARAVPVTVIIDKNGKLRHKVIGDLEREEIEKYFQELINEEANEG